MNVVEIIFLMSLAMTSCLLMLSAVAKGKFGSKYKQSSDKRTLTDNMATAYAEIHDSVVAESNVVSLAEYRARKAAQTNALALKVNEKETRIIYPLKKLKS